jgi:hypothetical protein
MRRNAHQRGNLEFGIKKIGKRFTVDSVVLFVNQPPRVHNVEPSLIVIDSLQRETLLSRHAQILDTVNWYQAARTMVSILARRTLRLC